MRILKNRDMREIKFRFYDQKESVMRDEVSDGRAYGINQSIKVAQDNDYIVMQYTGLNDRNGVEIYEGDKITINHHEGVFTVNDLSFVYTFEYCDGLLGSECEVIGNIYERHN